MREARAATQQARWARERGHGVSEVTITVNRRPYRLACEDGQEPHLLALAERVDGRVNDLIGKFGQIGDQQLLVMVGLLLADEAAELRRRLDEQEHLTAERGSAFDAADEAAAGIVETLAARIEALADGIERATAEMSTS
jgi:cell division protein ZapA